MLGARVDRLRKEIREAVGVEASVDVSPWMTRVSLPRPDTSHPGWPALIEALRRSGGRWGNLATADGSYVWAELQEDDREGSDA